MTNDPREKVISLGNDILDLLFEDSILHEKMKEHEGSMIMALISSEGEMLTAVIRDAAIHNLLDRKLAEYVAIRQTISAMEQPSTPMPDISHTTEEL